MAPVRDPSQLPGANHGADDLARDYDFTDLDCSRPDCWRYMVEVQDLGRPADPTG